MQKAGTAGVCSIHLWAQQLPCEGCAREAEAVRAAKLAKRDALASTILVALISRSGQSSNEELSNLPVLALELADKFFDEKEKLIHASL